MGRVESNVRVPVEQAQLIDAGSFRFDRSMAQAAQNIGGILSELGKRKQEAQDRISSSNVNAAMNKAQLDYQQEIVGKPLDQHSSILMKHVNNAKSLAGQQRMTNEARELANARLDIWGQTFAEQGELATIVALNKEAGIRVADDLGKALVNDDADAITEAEIAFDKHYAANPEEGKQQKEKIEALAVKQMRDNAEDSVFAAIEAASSPEGAGDFTIAKELAKSGLIDEKTQSSLRSSIQTAESAFETRKTNAIKAETKRVTSQTVTDFWTLDESGNSTMTVPELMRRRATGFLEDAEFKSMMESLTTEIPKDSDGFALGKIRRGIADFNTGGISRSELDKIVLDNYSLLDGPDRSNIPSEVEAESSKVLAMAKLNAYAEGASLRSVQFVGIQTESDFVKAFAGSGLTEEEKKRVNRRRIAEINNQDLYERAVSDRLNEMRDAGIEDVNKYRSESLSILLQYQNRHRLNLEALEENVQREQVRRARQPESQAKPLKKVSEMSKEEKLAELRRLSL